jgi:hypothetical protein
VASFLYDKFRSLLGTTSAVDLDAGTLGMFFVDEGTDVPSQTADNFVSDRTAGAQIPAFASAPNLVNNAWAVSSSVGVLDADDLTFTALSGASAESIDLYVDTGTNTTSTMISNHDDYTGLPLTPSGSDVVIVFAATGIIRI